MSSSHANNGLISIMTSAFAEARRRGDGHVGPAHLLIAVAHVPNLLQRGIAVSRLRDAVDELLGPSQSKQISHVMMGTTLVASRAIKQARERAAVRGDDLAPSDVLFELLDVENEPGIAELLLTTEGVNVDTLRLELQAVVRGDRGERC